MAKDEVAREPSLQLIEDDKYSSDFIGRLAKAPRFEQVTIVVIMLNACAIGWDADYSARWEKPDNLFEGPIGFIVVEVGFCIYFTLEILVRFFGQRTKWRCVFDGWFVFDSTLVSLMLVETVVMPIVGTGGPLGQLSILRLLRLMRITRMAKLMRAFPQLFMIVKGISAAVKAVFWSAVLLVIITFTWAIMFTSQYHQGWKSDAEAEEAGIEIEMFFGSMGKSMLSLLIMGTILDDVTACSNAIRATGSLGMLVCFLLYILLNSFTMLNMLTGILVEVVGSTAESERDKLIQDGVKESISTIFNQMDKDGSGQISREEFLEFKEDPQVMAALQELDIREKHFDMYVDLLFSRNVETLNAQELLDCICRLRPGAMVSALDFAAFRECIVKNQEALGERLGRMEDTAAQMRRSCGAETEASTDRMLSFRPGQDKAALQITPSMLAEVENASSNELVLELHRRLGVSCLEESRLPPSSPVAQLPAPAPGNGQKGAGSLAASLPGLIAPGASGP